MSPDVNASEIMQNMIMNDDDKEWYEKLFRASGPAARMKDAKRRSRAGFTFNSDIPNGEDVGLNCGLYRDDPIIEGSDHRPESYGIFIQVPIEIVRQLEALYPAMSTRSAVDDSPPHVTVLYMGDLDPNQASRARAICAQVLSGMQPFAIQMAGTAHFHNPESSVFHVRVMSDRLTELHHSLRTALESAGIPVAHTYGPDGDNSYKGHITLAYLPSGQSETEIPVVGSWVVDRVEVWNMSSPVSLRVGQRNCLACAAAICRTHVNEGKKDKKDLLCEPEDVSSKKKKRQKESNAVGAGSIRGVIGDPVLKARKKNARINARAFGGGSVVGGF